jgi:hypothetical protein
MNFEEYFQGYGLSGPREVPGGSGVMNGVSGGLGPESVQGFGNVASPSYAQPPPPQTPADIGELVGPGPASGAPVGMGEAESTMRSLGVNDSEFEPPKDGGIGLMGTLGILNLGAGLGSQIYKMVTAEKPRRPRMPIPMPGGNPMR